MKKNKTKFINIIIFLLIIIFFINKNKINDTVIMTSELFINNVFGYIFIMYVMQNLLINYNFMFYLNKFFNINYTIMILSILSGSPNNVILIKELVNKNIIDIENANKIIGITLFNNPLFLYNMLSLIFDIKTTYIIILSTYLSNIIQVRKYNKSNNIDLICNQNLPNIVLYSIKNGILTCLNIFGIILFFQIITIFIISFIKMPILNTLCSGILEITQGLNNLYLINISGKIKEIISIIIISFGGVSIHMQVYDLLVNTNIKYSCFLKKRIKTILYSLLIYLLIKIIIG